MIEFTKAFKASDGNAYATLEDAQKVELSKLLELDIEGEAALILRIVDEKAKIVDILTTKESSRPKARKVNGGKKTRAPKVITTPETMA